MFPTRYFADRYYAPRYFAKVGADPVAGVGQSPRGTRYRGGYRVDCVTGAVILLGILFG